MLKKKVKVVKMHTIKFFYETNQNIRINIFLNILYINYKVLRTNMVLLKNTEI